MRIYIIVLIKKRIYIVVVLMNKAHNEKRDTKTESLSLLIRNQVNCCYDKEVIEERER